MMRPLEKTRQNITFLYLYYILFVNVNFYIISLIVNFNHEQKREKKLAGIVAAAFGIRIDNLIDNVHVTERWTDKEVNINSFYCCKIIEK